MSVCGIDLGNDCSEVAIARRRGIDVCNNEVSKRTTASLVAFTPRERALGEAAASQFASNVANTVGCFKRVLGRAYEDSDVQRELGRYFVKAGAAKDGTVAFSVLSGGQRRTFTATQVTAMMLKKLKETAETEAEGAIRDCVIAVPVWYTDGQRAALLDAAKIAGFHVLGLISEPAAVGVCWGMPKSDLPDVGKPVHVAFADFGESACTVSIGSFEKGKMSMRSVVCDRELGGRSIDDLLVEHFAAQIKAQHRVNIFDRPRSVLRLRNGAQRTKHTLSANLESVTSVECVYDEIDAKLRLHRDEFNQLCLPLQERVRAVCEQALANAGLTAADVAQVEVVGQASRVLWFQDVVKAAFAKEQVSTTMNVSEAVARGATLLGAVLSPAFQVREFEVHDFNYYPINVSWQSFGGSSGGVPVETQTLFPQAGPIVSIKQVTFRHAERIELTAAYAPEAQLPSGVGSHIGRFEIKKIPAPRENAQSSKIKLKVRLNWRGVLSVDAAQLIEEVEELVTPAAPAPAAPAPAAADAAANGAGDAAPAPAAAADAAPAVPPAPEKRTRVYRTDLTVSSSTGALSDSDVDMLIQEERALALRDKEFFETTNAKNAVESYVYDMRRRMDGPLAQFVTTADKDAFLGQLAAAEEWLYGDGDDVERPVYEAKLAELRKIGDAASKRASEAEQRPAAVQQARAAVQQARDQLQSADEKYAHITTDERQKSLDECAALELWLGDRVKLQDARAPTDEPVFAVSEVQSKVRALEATVKQVMSKPKPAPPKTEAPAEQPAPAADKPAEAPKADGAAESGAGPQPAPMDVD